MNILYPHCCGIDDHKNFVVACLSIREDGETRKEIRRFGTMSRDLIALRDWLREAGTHVGMESTGVYWRTVSAHLYGFFEIVVANAQHMRVVPGRKTDVRDAEWIADLLQHGFLLPSCVPSPDQQDLRDLTRMRISLVEERARLINRIHTLREEANIKLASVLSDLMGVSGQAILHALAEGEVVCRSGLGVSWPRGERRQTTERPHDEDWRFFRSSFPSAGSRKLLCKGERNC